MERERRSSSSGGREAGSELLWNYNMLAMLIKEEYQKTHLVHQEQ